LWNFTSFSGFYVANPIMNRPWEYANELYDYISDHRKTVDSLQEELRQKYSMINMGRKPL
jgi:hypothetical protein